MLGDSQVATAIAVNNMEAAVKFYTETLGLKKDKESLAGTSLLAGGGTAVFVYPSGFAGTNKATYAGFLHEDVEAVAEDLKSKGVTLEQYKDLPGVTLEGDLHKADGGMTAIWFKDPDGNILSVSNMM